MVLTINPSAMATLTTQSAIPATFRSPHASQSSVKCLLLVLQTKNYRKIAHIFFVTFYSPVGLFLPLPNHSACLAAQGLVSSRVAATPTTRCSPAVASDWPTSVRRWCRRLPISQSQRLAGSWQSALIRFLTTARLLLKAWLATPETEQEWHRLKGDLSFLL